MADSKHDISEIAKNRGQTIVKTSIVGIITNVALAGVKVLVGLTANSIALILDAVNNLSDSLSSLVTILGEKLASKKPDKEHPMGYGRIEYLSAMVVAAIVLYAGITSLVESRKKIIHPNVANYTLTSILIIGITVVAKVLLGLYVKKQGKKVESMALIASGSDALFDALISLSVLVSALIFMIWHISLEAYVGALISIFMIKAGLEMMSETMNNIIGQREDRETIDKVRQILADEEDVKGVYDLALFNYGPNKYYCTAHLELPDTMTVDQVDRLTRKLQYKLYKKTGMILISLGVYSYAVQDKQVAKMRETVENLVLANDWVVQVHGFYAYTEEKIMRFDVVLNFDVDAGQALDKIRKDVQEIYPNYEVQIVPDVDYNN